MYVIANTEEKLCGVKLPGLSSYSRAGWYSYAIFIGESITRNTDSKQAWATRSLLPTSTQSAPFVHN